MTEEELMTIVISSDIDPVNLELAYDRLEWVMENDGKPYDASDLIELAKDIVAMADEF